MLLRRGGGAAGRAWAERSCPLPAAAGLPRGSPRSCSLRGEGGDVRPGEGNARAGERGVLGGGGSSA